jgi:hypothetical protein
MSTTDLRNKLILINVSKNTCGFWQPAGLLFVSMCPYSHNARIAAIPCAPCAHAIGIS